MPSRDSRHEEEAQRPVIFLQHSEKRTHRPAHVLKKRRIADALRERCVVFVDQNHEGRGLERPEPGVNLLKRSSLLFVIRESRGAEAADAEVFQLNPKILRIRKPADFREIEMNDVMRFLFPELFDPEPVKIPQPAAEQGING